MTEKSLTNEALSTVTDNYRRLSERIENAKIKAGRTDDVHFMAVTKTVPPEIVNHSVSLGIKLLGETRVQEFLDKYIVQIFRQVVKARSYRVFFTLKYEENFFIDSRWERVLDLFNFYHNSMRCLPQSTYFKRIGEDTLFDFARATYDDLPTYYAKAMTRQEIRELFAFVREENPALFEDFY